MGVGILGVEIVGIDILGVDILGRHRYMGPLGCLKSSQNVLNVPNSATQAANSRSPLSGWSCTTWRET